MENINSLLFVDEIKFSRRDNDTDDSFYFLGVLAEKESIPAIRKKYQEITIDLKKGFHATKAYKIKAPNTKLMENLTNLILDFNLRCFVFKYDRERFSNLSKKYLMNLKFEEKEKFTNPEFQAFFYFIQVLEFYFQIKLKHVKLPIRIYCDRGIYGRNGAEVLEFYSDKIETATFCSKNKIDLLALPDHFGYIFRNCRAKYNAENGSKSLNELKINHLNPQLLNNCILSLSSVFSKGLFTFLDIDEWFEEIEKTCRDYTV